MTLVAFLISLKLRTQRTCFVFMPRFLRDQVFTLGENHFCSLLYNSLEHSNTKQLNEIGICTRSRILFCLFFVCVFHSLKEKC